MATSPGLQQEYTMTTSENDQVLGHETSEMADDLETPQQDGSIMQTDASPEVFAGVNVTDVLEQKVSGDATPSAIEDVNQNGSSSIAPLHTNMTDDVTVDMSDLDNTQDKHASALGGSESAYVKHPQFDIDAQDVPMTDKMFDDGDEDFVFPALDEHEAINSWQASDDVSMEEDRLFNHDTEQYGKRSSSLTVLGMTQSKVNADIIGNTAVQKIAVEASLEPVENQTNLTNTFENASTPQFKLDPCRNHPVTVVENTDKFNNANSNAETVKESVETAMVRARLGDEVHSIMEREEVLVEGVESLSQSCMAKEESEHDEPAQDGIIVQEVEIEDANVASSLEVHSVDSKRVESTSDDQLPLMDGKVVPEIHGGVPVVDDEEELVEAAPEQVEKDRAHEQWEEPTKGHQEIVHECYVWEGGDRKTVEGVTNESVEEPFKEEEEQDKELKSQVEECAYEQLEGPHKGHQELVAESCSVQEDLEKHEEQLDSLYSSSIVDCEIPPTLMVEHMHACHERVEEKQEEEEVLDSATENEESTLSSMEDRVLPEKHLEKLHGGKVPKEISIGKPEGGIPKESGGERDEAAGKSPSVHRGEKLSRKKRSKAHKEGTVFRVGDMVWAKVKSHPWWPAQIFDPTDASKAARKLKKPGRALVAFYGDCTFAWLEQSQMIAFRPNFEEKVTQTTMRSFCMAVGEALEEFCRRSELGLRCKHCKGPPLHSSTSTFPEANTGIREGVKLENSNDMSTSVRMFRPDKVLEFARRVACSPFGSWNSTLCLSELRGHAYGVRTCMVALGGNLGAPILQTTIRCHVSKVKRSYTFFKDDKEPVVEGGKQAKKPKLKEDRPSAGEGEPSDRAMDGEETLLVLAGSKIPKSRNKTEQGISRSLHKVRRHTIGGEPATPKRRETKSEAAFVHTPPYLDGKFLGTRAMKKRFVVSETGSRHVAENKAHAAKDVPAKKDDYGTDTETSKKLIKVGDSIKKVAGELTGMAPFKHADELSAKSSKPGPKKRVLGLPSELQGSPLKKEKARFQKTRGDMMVAMDSFKKAGGAASKADEPQRKGNKVDEAKARPHWQNVPHKSQKSCVQELTLAARKRKSELQHEVAVSKAPMVTMDQTADGHAAKVVSKSTENPSDRRSSFEKSSVQYSRRQETKGTDEGLDEKLSSHLPLGLFMKFPEAFPLPSESQLKAKFLPFGPLQTSSTRLYKDSSSAQVVFKHGRDAESALKHAKKNALFGPIAVTYRLRHLLHSMRIENKTLSGEVSTERKPSSVEEKEGPPPSSEENTQDVELGASTVPILSDGVADMQTSDIQDKMMNLLRQVSVIVNP